jgi:LPXTG-motif cell wall-anchored protein
MLKKLLFVTAILVPLATFAEGNERHEVRGEGGYEHHGGWNWGNHGGGDRSVHAPEIDGSNAVLGLALLGGILTLMVRRKKK